MRHSLSLRLRVTLVCGVLLAVCCLLLTLSHNYYAYEMADAIEANNAAALAGEPDELGRRNCPYIETRDGLWAIRVDPTFYLTTAGLAIDTDCHVLTEDKKAIPGLYAAGDVCGSIEEKDAKQYGMGFDAALTYGYIMGETLKKEI